MRYGRIKKRWKWGGILLVAAMLCCLGRWGIKAGRQWWEQWDRHSWRAKIQERILLDAIGFLSPTMGWAWQKSDVVWQEKEEVQLLLLKEQGEYQLQGQEDSAYETIPEDGDEWDPAMVERDEDLLAEIDRENEALRRESELLQESSPGETAPQEDQSLVQTDTPPMTEGAKLPLPYSQEQLASREFLLSTIYNVNKSTTMGKELLDAEKLLSMDMALQKESDGPKILIHHTHATEYFADSNEKDEDTLIVGVGDYLEELLEERYGIQVIHDRTVYPYNEAYSQALKNVEQILEDNPTIEVFIDLHRDAGGTKSYTVNIDGKETAHLMFFNGLSQTQDGPILYLPNDNQEANLAFSLQLKMAGDSLYPGLCKRNYVKAYRYNLHVLPKAVIVEVGDHKNTLQEAKNAMEPLAQILYYVLMGDV